MTKRLSLTPSIVLAVIAGLLVFLAYAPSAYAQYQPGCGGVAVTGVNCMTGEPTTQQCSSAQRAYGEYRNVSCSNGDVYADYYGSCVADVACQYPIDATLTANPTSVARGNSISLTWSSTGATSCTSSGSTSFNTNGATSGTVSVAPLESATFAITCTGQGGSVQKGVNVTVTEPIMAASCQANKSNALVGETVRWTALAWNGTAPYSYSWIGQVVGEMTGATIDVQYDTIGEKNASIQVTDSASLGAGMSVTKTDSQRCTGTALTSNITAGLVEDGGYHSDIVQEAFNLGSNLFYGSNTGWMYDQGYQSLYDDMVVNPENYCVEVKLTQQCNPNTNPAWQGCNWHFRTTVHQGSGTRSTNSSDFGDYAGTWDRTRFYGTITGRIQAGLPRTITQSCQAPVTVTQAGPTALLTANPTSVTQGSSSTLTYTCTNSTSASIAGLPPLSGTSGTVQVTPGSTTTYTLTCEGAGGTATDNETVTVTAAPQTLSGSCSVSPTSITTGQSATWTASATGGNGPGTYTYSWTGTGGLTGSGQSVSRTYSTAGTYTGSVTITSGTQSTTVSCSNSVTVTTTTPTQPGPPTNGSYSCNAAGTQATLSWSPPSTGTTPYYFVRISKVGSCPSGWMQHPGEPSWCTPNPDSVTGTSVTYTTTPGQSYSYWVYSSYQGGAVQPPLTGSFTCTAQQTQQPDLTVTDYVSPTSATTNIPVTISGIARNIGTATSGSFPILIQVDSPAALRNTSYMAAMAPGGSGSGSVSHTFTYAGSYSVRACANYNTSWTAITPESNYSNNCGPWTTISVTDAPAGPDLTAGSVSPTTATVNTAVTLSALISNIGGSSTGAAFNNLFQRANSSSGSGAIDIGTFYSGGALGAGLGINATRSYTFTTAGTWYVRACADKSSAASTGGITEANEGNNCGPWTAITVGTGALPNLSCNVSDENPDVGETVTYSVSGGSSPYTWDPSEAGAFSGGSSITRSYASAGTYSMEVSKSGYTSDTCDLVTVGSGVAACTNPTANITASPDRVRAGQTTTVSWDASGIDTSCTITGTDGYSNTVAAGTCVVPTGSVTRTINTQTTFRINCDGGEATDEVVVNVIPRFIEF